MARSSRRAVSSSLLAALAAGGMAIALGGCSHGDPNYNDVRWNISPDLMTLDKRPVDVDRDLGYSFDTNYRMFWGDLTRAALVDRPSRLTREPLTR
jgi:hypothetical protein